MAVSARLPFLRRVAADGAGAGGSGASTLARLVRLEAEGRAGSGSAGWAGLVSRAGAFRFRVDGGALAVGAVGGWAGD